MRHKTRYIIMVILVVIVLVLFDSFRLREKELFFLSYQIIPELDLQKPVKLMKLVQTNEVITQSLLVYEGEEIKSLFLDCDRGKIIVDIKRNAGANKRDCLLRVTDLSGESGIKELHYSYLEGFNLLNQYLIEYMGKSYFCLEQYTDNKENPIEIDDQRLVGIDLKTNIAKEIKWECVKDIVKSGNGWIVQEESRSVIFFLENNKLYKLVGGGKIQVGLNISIPSHLHEKNNCGVFLLLQNNSLLVLSIDRSEKVDGLWVRQIVVYNKKTNEWQRKYIKGNRTLLKSFGQNIAGVVVYSREKKKDSIEVTDDESFEYQVTTKGIQDELNISAPGILFVLDTKTNVDYEFFTNESDSEVIFVRGLDVYWRKKDEIYRSNLSNGTFVNHELIVKNDEMEEVHWMFMR